jgi:hypothetical protein
VVAHAASSTGKSPTSTQTRHITESPNTFAAAPGEPHEKEILLMGHKTKAIWKTCKRSPQRRPWRPSERVFSVILL